MDRPVEGRSNSNFCWDPRYLGCLFYVIQVKSHKAGIHWLKSPAYSSPSILQLHLYDTVLRIFYVTVIGWGL